VAVFRPSYPTLSHTGRRRLAPSLPPSMKTTFHPTHHQQTRRRPAEHNFHGLCTSGSEMAARRQDTSCPAGYFHYTCNFDGHNYAGCCSVDACKQNPVGCPLAAQPRTSTTKTWTTSSRTSSSLSSPAPTTVEIPTLQHSVLSSSASATSPAATAVTGADGKNNHGILIPLGGLIALVVISAIVAVAGAILAWQRWCKRHDKRAEDSDIAAPDLPAMYQALESTPGPLPGHQGGTFRPLLPHRIRN
jgi:hypothetical protein